MATLITMPADVLRLFTVHLPLKEILRLSSTCKHLKRTLSDSPDFWWFLVRAHLTGRSEKITRMKDAAINPFVLICQAYDCSRSEEKTLAFLLEEATIYGLDRFMLRAGVLTGKYNTQFTTDLVASLTKNGHSDIIDAFYQAGMQITLGIRQRVTATHCIYVFIRGAQKGMACGQPVVPGYMYCRTCVKKKAAGVAVTYQQRYLS